MTDPDADLSNLTITGETRAFILDKLASVADALDVEIEAAFHASDASEQSESFRRLVAARERVTLVMGVLFTGVQVG